MVVDGDTAALGKISTSVWVNAVTDKNPGSTIVILKEPSARTE